MPTHRDSSPLLRALLPLLALYLLTQLVVLSKRAAERQSGSAQVAGQVSLPRR